MATSRGSELADLIEAVRERTGLSFRDLADRARAAGHAISHQQLAEYAHGSVSKMPTPEQLQALAAALDMPFIDVDKAAFMEWHGHVPEVLNAIDGTRYQHGVLIPSGLDDGARKELQRLIDAWVSAKTP